MEKNLKYFNRKRTLSLVMSTMLTFNIGVFNYFDTEINAAVIEDPNRVLTVNDIPDTILLNKLIANADANKDKNLTIAELQAYKGDSTGLLDLSNLSLTSVKGLGYAITVKSINLTGNSSLNNIANETFMNCKNLVSIKLPTTIETIGDSAFSGCSSLTTINLPNIVTNIGATAFSLCTSLTSITLPPNATLGKGAFSQSNLKSITIPKGVTVGEDCFNACESLASAYLPEGMTSIPVGCFNTTAIREITIPTTVQSIGAGAFKHTSFLSSIDLSTNTKITSIGESAFSGSALSTIILPVGLTDLGARAFENCIYLKTVKIPKGITRINDLTFSNCISLDGLTFVPSGKIIGTTVDNYALKEIGLGAFQYCVKLGGTTNNNVDFLKNLNNLDIIGKEAFKNCSYEVMTLNASGVYVKLKDEYGRQVYEGIKSVELPANLTQLGNGAFSYCGSLETIVIPNKVTIIDDNCFLSCENLANITLSNTLTSIGANSFENCIRLNNITTFPASLKKIGAKAFLNCSHEGTQTIITKNIQYVDQPDGTIKTVTTTITTYKYERTGMDTLTLPDNLTDIGTGAFMGCFTLTKVKLPLNLTQLGDSIFQDCGRALKGEDGKLNGQYVGITSVVFPNKLTSIGASTFKNCYKLNLVAGKLPTTLSLIGISGFENCNHLTGVVIPSSLISIAASGFAGCSNLINLDFSYATNLTTIGTKAFANDGIIGVLNLPDKITTIQSEAFNGCYSISSVKFPDGLISIGSSSFKNCFNLGSITIPATATMVYSGTSSSFYGSSSVSRADIVPVPKTVTVMENSQLVLPVNCFTEINSVKLGDETNATAEFTTNKVTLKGLKATPESTTVTISGVIQYTVSPTGVNRIQSTVVYDVKVLARKCIDVKFDQSIKGLTLANTVGLTLKPVITPSDTTDLKVWSSSNPSVATVSSTGVVKPIAYGTITINLTVGDKQDECIVNVCAPANLMTLDKTSANLILGDKLSITATLKYASTFVDVQTNYPDIVIWSSSNPDVATVDQSGQVTGLSYGDTVITAKADAGNITKTCNVSVIPSITNISFDKTDITLIKGNTSENIKTITMKIDPPDSPLSKIKIVSSNVSKASVSVTGNILTITAVGSGTATISATPVNGTAALCNVTITSPINSITATSMTVKQGILSSIYPKVLPSDFTEKILYSSNNTNVATVDSTGRVTGVTGGTAIITLKSESGLVTATCEVTVIIPVTGVSFTTTSGTLIQGKTLQLGSIAVVKPTNATNSNVNWFSNDTTIATVDVNGLVTAVGVGTTSIKVTSVANSTCSATYTVKVSLPTMFDVNNDSKIDMKDVALVAKALNSKSGSSTYNVIYDFNADKVIDIFDMVLITKYIK